ncbi:MAG: hypothetical protein ACD_23C00750G0005 [uncultured bacterium]|nr:MAG: hypothetical protein ACD_23C00750G0005 [uncultured bacterium]
MNALVTTQAHATSASTRLEQLQVLGFTDEADYQQHQQHQQVMQASRDLAATQLATVFTVGESTTSDVLVVTDDLNDRYAEAIIGERSDHYDGIEIQGVRNLYDEGDPQGTCIEVDAENPQFYSVYLHLKSGGCECVGDMGTQVLAQVYAGELSARYGWRVHDFTYKVQ